MSGLPEGAAEQVAVAHLAMDELGVRLATGDEMLRHLKSPSYIERRTEMLLSMADAIGVEHARRITDRMLRKEQAIYTIFEHDLLPPVSRIHLDHLLGQWVSATEDWQGMMEAHAAEVAAKEAAKPPQPEQPERINEPEDAGLIPPENRIGAHLLQMSDAGSLNGTDEGTDSTFEYTRYHYQGQEANE